MLTAVVGINWGDEGKGRMVDLLSSEYDVVVRYQGGNNAGHTVINDRGKFVLNLLPSGILRETTVNVMGNGMVIDIAHLAGEIRNLKANGIKVNVDNLKISDKAVICMPYHRELDVLEETRLSHKKYGSTQRGIAPAYSDKYLKKALRMMDLLEKDTLTEKVRELVEWKNMLVNKGYGASEIDVLETVCWLNENSKEIVQHICDVTIFLNKAADEGKKIMFEAQLGALRDIDFGIYPYTSSSSTLAAYAPLGSGIPAKKTDKVIGIMKAYSSCVGEGPFVCEMEGDDAISLREAGAEFGAATGRPRRVGGFDVVASKYGVMLQGPSEIALTKLDVLHYMEEIPVCVAYDIDGQITTDFPTGERLLRSKPVYEFLKGFRRNISGCRKESDLPDAALEYIRYIESAVGCKIKYVSVGPKREDIIILS